MAESAPTSRRKRRSAAPAPAPAPSRIRNKRQQQIVETVEGYESVLTYGTAVSAIQLLWAAIGLVFLGVGIGMVVLGPSDTANSLRRVYEAMGYGIALLTFLTTLVCIVWAGQATFNVSKLGRNASYGQVGIVGRHLPGILVGVGLLVAAESLSSYERPLKLLGGAALIWGLLLLAGLGHGVSHMLWKTSALGDPSAEPSNRDITLWFVGIVVLAYSSIAVELLDDISLSAVGFLIFIAGLGTLLASITALRAVPAIGLRQESRLLAILESFNEDDPGVQPVTAQQIEDAWEASSDLFTLDGH